LPPPALFPDIEPLTTFNYVSTPPHKYRPYKSVHHPTTALQALPTSELFLIDSSYASRLKLRRRLLTNHPQATYGQLPQAVFAVLEFYNYLVSHHLPARFPTLFGKSPSGTLVQNYITTNTYPIVAQSAPLALRTLGENLDEDFVFLLPSADGSWRVSAFIACFPSGFDLSKELGAPLSQVHGPVLGLQQEMGEDLTQYFTKIKPGVENCVQRVNWSIVLDDELFMPNGGTHAHEGQEVDADKCRMRVERQTVWKLPETGAVMFGWKTYMYTLKELKEEGEAENLAEAIEGLGDDIRRHKGRGIWEEKVLAYLKG
jgi:hypothetical protein